MISYELALKLKEAGFRLQPSSMADSKNPNMTPRIMKLGKEGEYTQFYLLPTLSELIEACGKDGIFLWKFKDEWCAKDIDLSYDCFTDEYIDDHFSPKKGLSSEEAVANLYLALAKK